MNIPVHTPEGFTIEGEYDIEKVRAQLPIFASVLEDSLLNSFPDDFEGAMNQVGQIIGAVITGLGALEAKIAKM